MTIGTIFWILMLLWIVFGLFGAYQPLGNRLWYGHGVFAFILFFLLGWRCFGFIIQGP